MKSRMLFYSTCMFLCVTLTGKSQSIAGAEGDSLFAVGQYEEAALMYEHDCFFSGNTDTMATLLLKKVDCLKKSSRNDEVNEVLDRMRYDVLPLNYHARWRYESALASYLNGDFERALNEIALYENFLRDSVFNSDMMLIKVLSCHGNLRLQDAEKGMEELVVSFLHDSVQQITYLKRVEEIYDDAPSIKDPEKGVRLSTIVPGLGQLYAGYPLESAAAVLINAGALTLGIYNVIHGYPITGYTTGAGLVYTFYLGGQRRSKFLCEKRNYKTQRELDEEAKKIFREIILK